MAKTGETKMTNVPNITVTNPYGRVDEELLITVAERDKRRKKRAKCLAYVLLFAVLQAIIIIVFGLTIMKVKSPKFRVRSASLERFNMSTFATNASFNIRMNAELGVKNTNFGHYKYQNSTMEFLYKGIKVGKTNIVRGKIKARKTRKFNVTVDLSSANVRIEELGNDLRRHALISFTSRSSLKGKVEIMKIMKKKKSANMNCAMNINISSREIQDLKCK